MVLVAVFGAVSVGLLLADASILDQIWSFLNKLFTYYKQQSNFSAYISCIGE
jgi:hypothetical protein